MMLLATLEAALAPSVEKCAALAFQSFHTFFRDMILDLVHTYPKVRHAASLPRHATSPTGHDPRDLVHTYPKVRHSWWAWGVGWWVGGWVGGLVGGLGGWLVGWGGEEPRAKKVTPYSPPSSRKRSRPRPHRVRVAPPHRIASHRISDKEGGRDLGHTECVWHPIPSQTISDKEGGRDLGHTEE